MRRVIGTYVAVILLLSLGFFGLGALASVSAQELRDPMQPPPLALQKIREAKWAKRPKTNKAVVKKPPPKALQLTSILISRDRRVAIINDQMLRVGDKIDNATLVRLTRDSARLVRKGKVINLSLNNELIAIRKKAVESDL